MFTKSIAVLISFRGFDFIHCVNVLGSKYSQSVLQFFPRDFKCPVSMWTIETLYLCGILQLCNRNEIYLASDSIPMLVKLVTVVYASSVLYVKISPIKLHSLHSTTPLQGPILLFDVTCLWVYSFRGWWLNFSSLLVHLKLTHKRVIISVCQSGSHLHGHNMFNSKLRNDSHVWQQLL